MTAHTQFKVRLPLGMQEQLTALAKVNRRSCGAEIVARLQDSLATEPDRITIDLRLPKQLIGQLGAIASHKGISLDQVVEQAVNSLVRP